MDSYDSAIAMSPDEFAQYHIEQVRTFALLDVDIITARAFNDSNEAIGVVKACRSLGVPVVISFKIDNNGNLASGEALGNSITRVDQETGHYPTYYSLNCIDRETLHRLSYHPGYWNGRLHGIQAIPKTQGFDLTSIRERFPNLNMVGACGFDFSTLDNLCQQFIA
jgi:S-methylmethionine-dependent homocysteine/selenocysteine methylase